MDYLNEALFLEGSESGTRFRIINDQGSFVTNDEDFFAYMRENHQSSATETVEGFTK